VKRWGQTIHGREAIHFCGRMQRKVQVTARPQGSGMVTLNSGKNPVYSSARGGGLPAKEEGSWKRRGGGSRTAARGRRGPEEEDEGGGRARVTL
jgi:hypothetical protein